MVRMFRRFRRVRSFRRFRIFRMFRRGRRCKNMQEMEKILMKQGQNPFRRLSPKRPKLTNCEENVNVMLRKNKDSLGAYVEKI